MTLIRRHQGQDNPEPVLSKEEELRLPEIEEEEDKDGNSNSQG